MSGATPLRESITVLAGLASFLEGRIYSATATDYAGVSLQGNVTQGAREVANFLSLERDDEIDTSSHPRREYWRGTSGDVQVTLVVIKDAS